MGIGWIILINGLIGVAVYFVSVVLFQAWCFRKYGEETANAGFGEYVEYSDEIGEQHGVGMPLVYTVRWMLTMLLWEIEIPLKFYLIHRSIRERSEYEKESGIHQHSDDRPQ